jgi:AcrR family transcriptional regulator
MAPKLAEEYSELRKQQILVAAWDNFVEQGYQATTMRGIARRMGTSTGVIYTYFKGKEEILEAIMVDSLERNRQLFDRASQTASSRGTVQTLISTYLECCPIAVLKKSATGNIGIWAEAVKRDKIGKLISNYYSQLIQQIARVVEGAIARGEMPSGLEPTATARFYLAFYLGVETQLALVEGLDTPEYIESIKDTLSKQKWAISDSYDETSKREEVSATDS